MLVSAIHQPTPVLLPGESHGQRSLVGYSPKGGRVRHPWSNLACTNPRCSRAVVPSIFGTRDQFCGRQFSHRPWGWFGDDSNALHLLCTLFILLLYQFPLRSSSIRSQRLGTPALEAAPCVNSTRSSWCSEPCSALATFPFFVSFTLNHLPHPQLALTSFSSHCFLTPVCHLLLSVSHPQVKKAYDFS